MLILYQMKKVLLTILFSVVGLIAFISKNEAIKAYAVNNELDISVKYLTSSDAANYNNQQISNLNSYSVPLQAGDYAISLSIKNNTGFTSIGYRIFYNASICTPIYKIELNGLGNPVEVPIYDKGVAGDGLNYVSSLNTSLHLLGMRSMGNANEITDGIIYTYFVRPSHALSLEDEKSIVTQHEIYEWFNGSNVVNAQDNNGFTLFHYTSPTLNQSWIIGDIDHDGYITAADAQLILGVYVDYGVSNTGVYTAEYIGTFDLESGQTVDKIYVVTVSDVNGDGVVDTADANQVLDYYATYVAGQGNLNNYTGIIGTSTGLYTEYSVTFS